MYSQPLGNHRLRTFWWAQTRSWTTPPLLLLLSFQQKDHPFKVKLFRLNIKVLISHISHIYQPCRSVKHKVVATNKELPLSYVFIQFFCRSYVTLTSTSAFTTTSCGGYICASGHRYEHILICIAIDVDVNFLNHGGNKIADLHFLSSVTFFNTSSRKLY